jgi:hypothetical protein
MILCGVGEAWLNLRGRLSCIVLNLKPMAWMCSLVNCGFSVELTIGILEQ